MNKKLILFKLNTNYLIRVFYNDFKSKDFHAYSNLELELKLEKLDKDDNVHTYVVYSKLETMWKDEYDDE